MIPIEASSKEASQRMAKVRQKDTKAEMSLRRELHRKGLRYRVNFKVLDKPRRIADIVFTKQKLAIFVDGCFWHGCPEHATWPKQNSQFWQSKISTNKVRDLDTNERLRSIGWTVLRFWEHEEPSILAEIVEKLIKPARSTLNAEELGIKE